VRSQEKRPSRATRTARRRSVPISTTAPLASDVRITGDFTEWTLAGIPLWDEGDGSWRTLLCLDPGVYEYRMVIDGDWADHAEAHDRGVNPYGGVNCILTVR
jgi:1,4-alpha-glucan branching enzyme